MTANTLLPEPVWEHGLLPRPRDTGAGGGGVPAAGTNYTFTATQLLIHNSDEDKWYELWVAGAAGEEVLDYNTEQVAPVAAGSPPNSGTNFEFTDDGYLRFKNLDNTNRHTVDLFTEDSERTFRIDGGEASNPGVFAAQGNNYRFIGSTLQLYDPVTLTYHAFDLKGPAGDQVLEIQ